jgi:protein involved in polysaccharide export with SLBB domain
MLKKTISLAILWLSVYATAQVGSTNSSYSNQDSQNQMPAMRSGDMQQSQQPQMPTLRIDDVPRVPGQTGANNGMGNYGSELNNLNPYAPGFRQMQRYQRTEFEKYVEAVTGRNLRLFGQQYFENVPTTFAPVDRIPVRADYILGPGDELHIRAWGKIDFDARVVVDRAGQIYLPRVGAISVAGLRFDQLESQIHSAIAALYKDFELSVNVGQLRSIQVFVLGYAMRPGTYTVSSLSTLMNALFASGGPAPNGSMRHVLLKRNNVLMTDLDVYDLILRGDKSKDVTLQSGDVIYIPHIGPLVALAGSVNAPAIYEMRSESSLGEAIENAGGLSSVAETKRVSVQRINERNERVFEEFTLDPTGLQRTLKDGDIARIFPVSPRINGAVTLRGNVAQPGLFAWHEGMKISDLIPNKESLINRDYWNDENSIAALSRDDGFSNYNANSRMRQSQRAGEVDQGQDDGSRFGQYGAGSDLSGQPNWRGTAPNSMSMGDGRGASSTDTALAYGDVRTQGSNQFQRNPNYNPNFQNDPNYQGDPNYQRNPNYQRYGDGYARPYDYRSEIKRRGLEINWDYAVIERRNPEDLSTQLIPFNLGNAVNNPSSADDKVLQQGDIVTVFSERDVPVSTEKRAKFVQIEGEVAAPGIYRVQNGETLRDIVRRAGGLKSQAYLYAAELDRESTRIEQQQQLAKMVEQMQHELMAQSTSNAGLTNPQDRAAQQANLEEQRTMIQKLGQVQPTGRIVLEMKPTASLLEDIPNMPLEDGDRFSVPARHETVTVLGAVYNQNAFRYRPERRVSQYVNSAGGPTREADAKRMFIIRADGTVVSKQHSGGNLITGNAFESLKLMPGDSVVVPERLRAGNVMRNLQGWSQIFSSLGFSVAALSTIGL